MQKFRAAVMAVTLTAMFFIPMTAIPKTAVLPKEEIRHPQQQPAEEQEKPTEEISEIPKEQAVFRIYNMETEAVENVPYIDYVKGAIASEMGAGFELEALIAQGVAAFSCGLYQKNVNAEADYDFSAAPGQKLGYITEETAKNVYGNSFDEKWAKITRAAENAMQYVLTYEEKPALAVYHAISNGKTESAKNAWAGEIPYLVSVESPGDPLAEGYETKVTVKREDALEILNKYGAALNGKYPEEWFEGAELTDAGYVKSIKIGAATFSGSRLRSLFNLRSSAFTVKYAKGEFTFTVHGYGHGVGLSQIGANYMAQNGASFEEILAHYYPGTSLEKYTEE